MHLRIFFKVLAQKYNAHTPTFKNSEFGAERFDRIPYTSNKKFLMFWAERTIW